MADISLNSGTIGIIGGGLGGLMAYSVLRFRGVPQENIRVFSATPSPEKTWHQFVERISQKTMRSESIGHFLPTDSPGLASIEAIKTTSLKPIVLSWFDHYHPTVDTIINHIQRVAAQTNFYHSIVPCRVSRLEKKDDKFIVYNEHGEVCSEVNHIIIAAGHGHIQLPPAVKTFESTYPHNSRVAHAFTHKAYSPGETVVIVGSGLTAATEWMNVLEKGGHVIAVSRDGFRWGQDLNTPRKYFSRRGIKPYRAQSPAERAAELKNATRGTIPTRSGYWMRTFNRAIRDGRLTIIEADLAGIEPINTEAVVCDIRLPGNYIPHKVRADRVVVATGFSPATTQPLLALLIKSYDLPMVDHFLAINEDCTIPYITTPASKAGVIGAGAAWAVPCADSFGGMKIAAHCVADAILGPENQSLPEIMRRAKVWTRLVTGRNVT